MLLFEDDLRSALREKNESSAVAWYDRTHGFADGVERIDLVDSFLRYLLALRLVVLAEIEHEPEQRALRLVADLLR